MKISEYTHEDDDGDSFTITSYVTGAIGLRVDSAADAVNLNRTAVAALKAFLTEWEERTTPAPPTPESYAGLVNTLSEALSRPLVARSVVESLCHRPAPDEAHPASRCTWCGHLWITHRIADPEPHDVGHPDECTEEVRVPRQLVGCECGHRWSMHGWGGCYVSRDELACTCTCRPPADLNNEAQP